MKTNLKVSDLIARISNLGNTFKTINEILLFGSQTKILSKKSDVDILVIISDYSEKQSLLQNLYMLCKNYKILVHPVILTIDEFKIRRNIELYKTNIINSSQTLYCRNVS